MYNDPNQRQRPPYSQVPPGQLQQSPFGQQPYGQPQQAVSGPPSQQFGQPQYGPPSQQYRQPQNGQSQQAPFGSSPQQYGQSQFSGPPNSSYPPSKQPAQKPRRGIGRIILVVALVLVVLVAGGAIAFVVLNGQAAPRGTNTTTTPTTVPTAATNSPQAQTVTSYYSAIKNQDYNTAFTYLITADIEIGTQKLTQSLFSQTGQALDTQDGKVTAFVITNATNVTKNGVSFVEFTVSVTRKGAPYKVHLEVQQVNGAWKIVGIDNI